MIRAILLACLLLCGCVSISEYERLENELDQMIFVADETGKRYDDCLAVTEDSPPKFMLTSDVYNGCVARTLGYTRYQFWDPIDNRPLDFGWRVIVKIEAKDTLHHIASNKGTIRDEHGWVTGYEGEQDTTWNIELDDGWQVVGSAIHNANCLISEPGEPERLNTGYVHGMEELDFIRHWVKEDFDMKKFSIVRKSVNGWWGGSREEGHGSFMDSDAPLQKIELHFKIVKIAEE